MKQNTPKTVARSALLLALPALLLQLGAPATANAETESDRERRLRSEKIDKVITSSQMYKWLPEPGRERVGAMKPSWCHLTSQWKGKIAGSYMRRKLGQVKRYGMGGTNMVNIAEALCARPNQPTWRRQTGYVVQRYVNETGLSKKDAVAAIIARMVPAKWKRAQKSFCSAMSAPSAEASPEQKLFYKAKRRLYGCSGYSIFWKSLSGAPKGLLWQMDKRAAMDSEVMKAFAVLDCLKQSRKAKDKSPFVLGGYAVCGMDARSLNRSKLEREIARGPHNVYSRTIARETFASAAAAGRRYKLVIDALAKRDPAYKKLFYDAPKAGWNKWVASYRAKKTLFEATLAFELKLHGPSRRALAGCRANLRSKLTGYIKSQKVRNKKQLYKVLANDVSGRLLAALVSCTGLEGNQWEGYVMNRLLRKVRNAGGPRAAALYAIVDAVGEIRKDRTRFPFTAKTFGRVHEPDRENMQRKLWSSRKLRGSFLTQKGKGTVRSMKKTRHGIKLTFKKTRVKEAVHRCTRGAVWKIDRSGKVLYHRNCVQTGTQWVDTTSKPVILPVDAAGGIRRGSFIKYVADYAVSNPKFVRIGYPVVVYKTKRLKRLVAGFGFKL